MKYQPGINYFFPFLPLMYGISMTDPLQNEGVNNNVQQLQGLTIISPLDNSNHFFPP